MAYYPKYLPFILVVILSGMVFMLLSSTKERQGLQPATLPSGVSQTNDRVPALDVPIQRELFPGDIDDSSDAGGLVDEGEPYGDRGDEDGINEVEYASGWYLENARVSGGGLVVDHDAMLDLTALVREVDYSQRERVKRSIQEKLKKNFGDNVSDQFSHLFEAMVVYVSSVDELHSTLPNQGVETHQYLQNASYILTSQEDEIFGAELAGKLFAVQRQTRGEIIDGAAAD
ncbi:hypothetical protein [Alcanivorax sp. 1008]|uniref:hypothetical protein n=1 Tax=Alcanivorax sp. 1008 TaxID=2816853 RepID=UPI001D29F01D|nr:hypothetical protein [Alcanivorax sp. 1008]MCC1496486.1 hypothetical protein [Alcanivorax sp. 1008]